VESDVLLSEYQCCCDVDLTQGPPTDDRGTVAKNSSYLSRGPTSALFPLDLIRKKGVGFVFRCWWTLFSCKAVSERTIPSDVDVDPQHPGRGRRRR